MPTISVIIPTLNEEKYVVKLLDNLVAQTAKPDEVVIADCNSEDKTIQFTESYKAKLPIKIAHSKHRSPGAARNAGAKVAKSEYLLFIDADMHIPKDSLNQIQKSLTKKPVDFLTPAYRSDGKSFVDSFNTWLINVWMVGNIKVFHQIFAIGGVMCVKKEQHEKVGGFNENMVVQDDINYAYKLRRVKASYTYLRSLRVIISSRRWVGYPTVVGLLLLIVQNSRIGRFFLTPIASKLGLQKKYGQYK